MGPEPENRTEQGTFKPGCSGNPGGRPKVAGVVRALAQKHTKKSIRALVRALRDPKLCVAAAQALLDRGWGKPAQAITGPDGEKLTLSIAINLGGPDGE